MDQNGIDVQVISHAPPAAQLLDAAVSIELTREANEAIADAVRAYPARFGGFAALPTPAPKKAAGELIYAVRELGLSGAMVHGHTNGRYLDHPDFDSLLDAAAELAVPLYIHPGEPPRSVKDAYYRGIHPPGKTGDLIELLFSTAGFGWHADAAVHALRLILSGAFDRHPSLQIILGHHGELLPFYCDRFDVMTNAASYLERPVSRYLRENVYVTPSGLETTAPLTLSLAMLGADRVMYSSDYPYAPTVGRAYIDDAPLSDNDRHKIAHANAERLLPGLPTERRR